MSHVATHWALEQRGLKPATKVVLFHLADRHNTGLGCFPSQKRLADDCEMSRASVNQHLAILEARGLLKRAQRRNKKTHRQETTCYLFPFDEGFEDVPGPAGSAAGDAARPEHDEGRAVSEKPCMDSGHGAVSRNKARPCPENSESRVQNLDTNPVREPLREPCVGGEAAHMPDGFEAFWETYPRRRDRSRCQRLFAEAVKAGTSSEQIIRAAERYRAENIDNKPMYLAYADNWLQGRRWEDYLEAQPPAVQDQSVMPLAVFWADKVKARVYISPTAISSKVAASMISNGLVQEADLIGVGLRL